MRVRARARPNSPGNLVVVKQYGQWGYWPFKETPSAYVKSVLADPVDSKPYGYYNDPLPDPMLTLIEPQTNYQTYIPNPTPIEPQTVPPIGIDPGSKPTGIIPIPTIPGSTGRIAPGTKPIQIFKTLLKIRSVTVRARSTNALNITIGYDQTITSAGPFELLPGAAYTSEIGDLSQLWLVAQNSTDQVDYIYEQ